MIEQLRQIAPVTAVSGNVDDTRQSEFPSEAMIDLPGRRIVIRHILYEGVKLTKEGQAFLEREQPDVCIFGHTHQPNRLRENHFHTRELRWSARVAQWRTLSQDSRARQAGRVDLVHLVCLVHLVGLVQPNKREKPNKPNNGLRVLADFFSILLKYDRQPDDCVPEIAIATVNRKVAKPTDQLREWKLFGKDHAGMRTADFLPVCRKR